MFAQTTTHATLLARIAAGADPAAWRDFCERYGDLIRGFAVRQGLQAADCDDVTQDVFMSLAKSMPGFTYDPARGRFRSYLKTVVLHAIYQKSRQNRGEARLEDMPGLSAAAVQDESAEALWDEQWRQYHVRQAMRVVDAEYSDGDRRAFTAYAIEGRSAAEVAAELGMSMDAVYQAKSRILKRLGQIIEAQVAEEG